MRISLMMEATMGEPTSMKFWAKVDIADDCWGWQGAKRGNGYGAFWAGGEQVQAHRFAYSSTRGPIPEGMLVCHHCDNPNVSEIVRGTTWKHLYKESE